MDESLLTIIRIGLVGSVFALKLAQALPFSVAQLVHVPRAGGHMLRSLVAMIVVVPLVTLAVILLVRPPEATVIGLAIAAASPAAPLTIMSAINAGGRPPYVLALHLSASLLAVITVPITLELLGRALDFESMVGSAAVARQVALAVFVPTCLGIAIRWWWPALAERIVAPLTRVASLVLLVVLILVVVGSFRLLLAFDLRSYVAVVLMVAGGLAAGRLLGPPPRGDRTALALECASRNPGLAMLIASLSFPHASALHVLIPYLLAAVLTSTVYTHWRQRAGRRLGTGGVAHGS